MITLAGHLDPGSPDFVYLPVDVPHGVREIAVSYSYDEPPVAVGTLGNSCDIGIFDERGIGVGLRGWSGGARAEFAISAESATPGYLPGPVNAGRWHVVLGPYQVAPRGLNYQVQVGFELGETGRTPDPQYPPQHVAARSRDWYRGDCHLHTVHSDGVRSPEEVAAAARAAGLDFIVTTDHNTPASHRAWGPLSGDDLLIVTGEEVTTRNGHYLALGVRPGEWIDWRYRARDGRYAEFARQIHEAGGIVVPAHPYCPYVGCSWKFGYDEADAIEVWNGPWTLDDEAALATWDALLAARSGGRWLPAMGNSDAHRVTDVIGLPQTVVQADTMSRDAVLAAIAAGCSWIAESSAVRLEFIATNGEHRAGIGGRLAVDAPVDVSLKVSGVPDALLRIVSDEGEVLRAPGAALSYRTTPSRATYLRAEVRHGGVFGPMAALTNPIFLAADQA